MSMPTSFIASTAAGLIVYAGGGVAEGQRVGDGEAGGGAERGVYPGGAPAVFGIR
ncbi:hypothetical protein [Actinoplanes subglobosus]|uniref:Uncharacterized protein n=1 Tax=Actinoplanes subglobosus TaxID=1547892 RepID=A0ABV8IKY9_9ACTN